MMRAKYWWCLAALGVVGLWLFMFDSAGKISAASESQREGLAPHMPREHPAQPWVGTGKVAVLYVDGSFDPTNGPLIGFAIGNALGLLPLSWRVEVHTQQPLPPPLARRFHDHVTSGRLVHRILHKDNAGTEQYYLRGKAWAFTDPTWWEMIDGETVLMLHQTVTLCSGARLSVDDFVGFDYVGAPWKWAESNSPYINGGNGAFSLRSKAAILRVLKEHRPMKSGIPSLPRTNEDMFFVKTMSEMGGFNVSTRDVGKTFSVEELPYDAPVGVSYSMRTVPNIDRDMVLKNCPEARVLVGYLPGADWLLHHDQWEKCDTTDKKPNPPCPWL